MTEEEKKAKEAMEEQWGKAPELDLSKMKNIKASVEKGTISEDFEERVEEKAIKAKKSKFSFTEEHIIDLPTKGYLYQDADDEDIRNGKLRIRPMTLKDEEILSNKSYIKNGTVFTKLINSCMLNNFDARKLVSYDVYYIIYALREITYGQDYEFKIKCDECKKEFKHKMRINDVEFDELDENVEPIKTIKLPVSKYTVTIRYASLGDEEEAGRMSVNNDNGDISLNFAVRTVEILDEKKQPINPKDYSDFYEAIPGRDRSEITKLFKKIDDLKIPTIKCICPKCGEETEREIPFDRDFFRY